MAKYRRKAISTAYAILILVVVAIALLGVYYLYPRPTVTFQGTIQGAGATFPQPFYSNLSAQYLILNPGVQINYNGIGSGGGIRQFTNKTIDFGASDAPLTESQYANATGVLHIPMVIGGVVAAYNIPGVGTGLNFTGDVLARIFLDDITQWNDPAIQSLNPAVHLPSNSIVVVHRSDGSGTTFVWTQYLSAVNADWRTTVGTSTSVNWPVGLGGQGNPGVAGLISQNPYSIGYVEYYYAILNNISYGNLRNAAGNFVEPNIHSIGVAASAAALILPQGDQSWSHVSIVNAVVNNSQATDAYPLTSFTYILLYKDLSVVPGMTKDKALALVQFLWWAVHDGQQYATALAYVPLPQLVVSIDEATLNSVQFEGQTLLS